MQPSTPNRVITAILCGGSGVFWGGTLISNDWAFWGAILLLTGMGLGVAALLCSDDKFRKFPWVW